MSSKPRSSSRPPSNAGGEPRGRTQETSTTSESSRFVSPKPTRVKSPATPEKEPNLLSPFGSPIKPQTVPPPPDERGDKDEDIGIRLRHMDLLDADERAQYDSPFDIPKRPGFNTTGKDISLQLNAYKVQTYPTKKVYQYDVLIGRGDEKRALIVAVWESRTMVERLGRGWIFDGNKIAWYHKKIPNFHAEIDMDIEKGRPSRDNNKFRVQVKETKELNLYPLMSYLKGESSFNTGVLEAINFIDHLLRAEPAKKLLAIKRSFFNRSMDQAAKLGNGIVAFKGIYQTLRCAQGNQLVVNADVSNSCFWLEGPLESIVVELCQPARAEDICAAIQKTQYPDRPARDTRTYQALRKLSKLRFKVQYQGMSERIAKKTFIIGKFTYSNARNTKFPMKERETGGERLVSVFEYFKQRYDHHLRSWYLPCVETTKGELYPVEVCHILKGQRYPFKLSDNQVSLMIKYAATKPEGRLQSINGGLRSLAWDQDPNLKEYGLKINAQMVTTKAKLLPPPQVEFADGKVEKPMTNGRWRIDGKRFLASNTHSLQNWAVVIFNDWGRDRVNSPQVQNFIRDFGRLYQTYGGKITQFQPPVIEGSKDNIPDTCVKAYNAILSQCKAGGGKPQLICFVVSAKITALYNRVKKNCDCRFGIVSQVMQSAHVAKSNPQYIGNVLMKVNAKLGGFSFRGLPMSAKPKSQFSHFKRPTLIIGADVSHAGPGSGQASMAAVTCSMDRTGCRYLASCQSNGHRVEMISSWNLEDMLTPLWREWMANVSAGTFPQHVIYLRDGVSEGQFEHVIKQEVRDMKMLWEKLDQSPQKQASKNIKFTVVVASKRHHIRFFPGRQGDQNGNALPGTLVERDVTHPYDWDFYLCAHKAIQGTARPVHYYVISDEMKMNPNDLIGMIYDQSYSYVRSSTPVSIHPAIYYAHLAAKRAVAHERGQDGDTEGRPHGPGELREANYLLAQRITAYQTGKRLTSSALKRLQELTELEYPRLIAMNDENGIKRAMWFI